MTGNILIGLGGKLVFSQISTFVTMIDPGGKMKVNNN